MKVSKSVIWTGISLCWLTFVGVVSYFIGDKLGESVADDLFKKECK